MYLSDYVVSSLYHCILVCRVSGGMTADICLIRHFTAMHGYNETSSMLWNTSLAVNSFTTIATRRYANNMLVENQNIVSRYVTHSEIQCPGSQLTNGIKLLQKLPCFLAFLLYRFKAESFFSGCCKRGFTFWYTAALK